MKISPQKPKSEATAPLRPARKEVDEDVAARPNVSMTGANKVLHGTGQPVTAEPPLAAASRVEKSTADEMLEPIISGSSETVSAAGGAEAGGAALDGAEKEPSVSMNGGSDGRGDTDCPVLPDGVAVDDAASKVLVGVLPQEANKEGDEGQQSAESATAEGSGSIRGDTSASISGQLPFEPQEERGTEAVSPAATGSSPLEVPPAAATTEPLQPKTATTTETTTETTPGVIEAPAAAAAAPTTTITSFSPHSPLPSSSSPSSSSSSSSSSAAAAAPTTGGELGSAAVSAAMKAGVQGAGTRPLVRPVSSRRSEGEELGKKTGMQFSSFASSSGPSASVNRFGSLGPRASDTNMGFPMKTDAGARASLDRGGVQRGPWAGRIG
ncbi:unnamed protein product, partial [Sphacelaria rigidula]